MRHVCLVAVFIWLSFSAAAQLSFGPTASLNIATQQWKGNYAENYKLSPFFGFQAGVFGNYKLSEKFAAHAELSYSSEGTAQKNTAFGGSGYLNFNYVRLPLLGQYYVTDKLNVEGGLNLGVFIIGKQKWNGRAEKLKDGYKPVDAGISLGAAYNLSEFIDGITAGVRFYYGLSNIVAANDLNGGKFRNRSIAINVRYRLPFGDK